MEIKQLEELCERTDLVGCRIVVTELMATTRALIADISVQKGDELHIATRDAKRRLRPGPWEDDPNYSLMASSAYCSMKQQHGIISLNFFDVEAKIYTPESAITNKE